VIGVAALVVGGLGGAIAGWAGGKSSGTSSGTSSGAGALPQFPAQFPSADQGSIHGSIHGVTVSFLADNWLKKANGYECDPPSAAVDGGSGHSLRCNPKENLSATVRIDYTDQTHVSGVTAQCHLDPGSHYCKSLFQKRGETVLVSDPSLASQAGAWGAQHLDSDSTTTLGAYRLTTKLEPSQMSITVVG